MDPHQVRKNSLMRLEGAPAGCEPTSPIMEPVELYTMAVRAIREVPR
jgi:hypothetical protein